MSDSFAAWLRANPAPDLQELFRQHGGYAKIPVEAWAEYDLALAEWEERRRLRHAAAPSAVTTPDPEALCICGLPGVYMRPRKGGGRPIWRCEWHRRHWPEYAEDVPWKRAAE